ncbi:MAG: GNAT family N-acetyltransferase, partial [Candidatus Cloacimonetes bacterium]|nr:GNAT family N-acetyltransferase [Candidatus Cloacimonadota bacterium]
MRVGKNQRKNIRLLTMPQTGRLKNFKTNIPFIVEKKNYIVKTADSNAELNAALKLRHEVFLEEILNKKKRGGIDRDRF